MDLLNICTLRNYFLFLLTLVLAVPISFWFFEFQGHMYKTLHFFSDPKDVAAVANVMNLSGKW